ncbi:ABC-type proline/glycine betaine transport system, periplasmic component [Halobacteroides halobius DSM 5150]|uniref:ABC-type proline/glycine betaine transport system, periplasmic component n=1 Tax=Halobacteroides halobius (strain ATCC 35273 / DSM 5150 / MD-1) TaxID=748449 RepID=L0KAB2_HALHC|nr:ABC transporter substrate-binding protein [Halobacteroides halobius]AGB41946.1 ABC-type proline/glycine betaine transport system, periplasmic component [Halobacteroides halobius DSM 5150]
MFKKKSMILVLSLALILTLSVGCAQQKEAQNKTTKKVTFGYVSWPGVTVKTHVAKEVLESLGYKVDIKSIPETVIYKGMENDEIDAFLGNWMPTMKVNFKPYRKKGVIKNIKVNLAEALYQTAVPKYVWEAGVKSMADLHKYAEKFDSRIVGLEPGNSGNLVIKEAIDNNTYKLGNWKLQSGSTAAMLAAVDRATKTKEWIAFNGWKPHWMNIKFDLKYLKDPKGIWGAADKVYTAARPELEKKMPNFYKFLKQFEVSSQMQSQWILEYQKKGRPPEKVATEWIKSNLDIVKEWVAGLKTANGKDALKAIKKEFK